MKKTNIIVLALLCGGVWQLSTASWVHAKAIVAQHLLNHSWNLTLSDSGDNKHKPWPWADTWPVAKLTVPKKNIEQIVLAGDSGSSLAFGPGHSLTSTAPNTEGTTVISGHRDTHFQFLKDMKLNDTFYLQADDKTVQYRIYDFQIVDSKAYKIPLSNDRQTLILVTCYPFDSIATGGSSRYLVFAIPTFLT